MSSGTDWEVVNFLWLAEKPQPFDFLIDGELLRTSVEQFLVTKGITAVSLLRSSLTLVSMP